MRIYFNSKLSRLLLQQLYYQIIFISGDFVSDFYCSPERRGKNILPRLENVRTEGGTSEMRRKEGVSLTEEANERTRRPSVRSVHVRVRARVLERRSLSVCETEAVAETMEPPREKKKKRRSSHNG